MNSSAPDLFDVQGLVAVITGGGTGLGLMMATALEHRGATVYMVGRRLDVLESAAREHAKHGNLLPVQGDVTDAVDLARVVAHISARHEGVDLLVNNAGIARALLPRPALRLAGDIQAVQELLAGGGPEDFADVFAVNVTAPYFVALAFLPLLAAGGGGQIVTISSVHGRRHDRAISSVPYSLSKAAGEHLGQILAAVLADWKIRSNVIVAGLFPSEMTAPYVGVFDAAGRIPAGRLGSADDLGGLIVFLASKAGSYVNGASYVLDGGWLDWSVGMSRM